MLLLTQEHRHHDATFIEVTRKGQQRASAARRGSLRGKASSTSTDCVTMRVKKELEDGEAYKVSCA